MENRSPSTNLPHMVLPLSPSFGQLRGCSKHCLTIPRPVAYYSSPYPQLLMAAYYPNHQTPRGPGISASAALEHPSFLGTSPIGSLSPQAPMSFRNPFTHDHTSTGHLPCSFPLRHPLQYCSALLCHLKRCFVSSFVYQQLLPPQDCWILDSHSQPQV